ncbi:histidine kinase-like protein [Motilibacter peucedani]|uniref:Histidine kinase-like protein n=1 Tax=Motilibacter peucedani TaxID=598650 RepID=A0A420XRM5_9ACTN|nr:ATP-binding protein [Motilibacter peucedani]RKS77553.1 histidine kinase-like protein [Motilibacter peucedani]
MSIPSIHLLPFQPESFLARMSSVEGLSRRLRGATGRRAEHSPERRPREEVLRLLATVEAPAQTRRFVADILGAWGVAADVRDDVVLVVSELVSEAARYPLAVHVEVRLTRRAGRIELAVSDLCPEPPSCADARPGTASLVRAVLDGCSEHWDWSLSAPAGRTVRASIAC